MSQNMDSSPLLEMRHIRKSYLNVEVLHGIDLTLHKGEVLALCGENGSGKSTLMKVLSGLIPHGDFSGEIIFNNQSCHFKRISESEHAGIAFVHQELALVPQLSIADNIFCGSEFHHLGVIQWEKTYERAKELLQLVGLNYDPRTLVKNLSNGERQILEVARALGKNAKIIIFDEPTSSLSHKEVSFLLERIRFLADQGVACIYISHRMEEIQQVADRVQIIRDGNMIAVDTIKSMDQTRIVQLMVGREINNIYPSKPALKDPKDTLLRVENLILHDPETGQKKIGPLSFDLKKGEILGFSGLVGAGRSETMLALIGSWKGRVSGSIFKNGKKLSLNSSYKALKEGIALIPEDRKEQGVIPIHSIATNTSIASLAKFKNKFFPSLNRKKEDAAINASLVAWSVKFSRRENLITSLSGGNQQKVILARSDLTDPDIILLDEPTRGVDVGAKHEIYEAMMSWVKRGKSIIMVSSDMPEVLGLSHRIAIMHEGELCDIVKNENVTQEMILQKALLKDVPTDSPSL